MKYFIYIICISFVLIGACKSKEPVATGSRSTGVNTSRSGIKNGIEGEEKKKEETEKKEEKK